MPKADTHITSAQPMPSPSEISQLPTPREAMQDLIGAIQALQGLIRLSKEPAWVREDFLQESDFLAAEAAIPQTGKGAVKEWIEKQLGKPITDSMAVVNAGIFEKASWAAARNRIAAHIGELWHTNDEDGRETVKIHGWMMCAPELFAAAQAVNEKKEIFQAVARKQGTSADNWVFMDAKGRDSSLDWRRVLGCEGLGSRICLRQAYRKVHLIALSVRKIGFSYSAHSKNIAPMDREEVERTLSSIAPHSDHAEQQLRVLSTLQAGDKIKRVQNATPHYKANIVCVDGEGVVRLTVKCGMPFLIPSAERTPAFTRRMDIEDRLQNANGRLERTRLPRSDVAIDATAAFKTVRGHISRAKKKSKAHKGAADRESNEGFKSNE